MSLPLDAFFPITNDHHNQLKKQLADPKYITQFGHRKQSYGYYNKKRELVALSVRFEHALKPFYYTGQEWITGFPDNVKKFLPYNFTKKSDDCNNVFIVNFETQALKEIKGWHGMSWLGNCEKTIHKTNWEIFNNIENVIVWTDQRSAKKIKNKIPHAKIITGSKFNDCPNHLERFQEKLKIQNLPIPEPDPYEFYKLFIYEFYGEESLEQRSGVFWRYRKSAHHWKQEQYEDIKANFQYWFTEQREDNGASILEYTKSEGLPVNTMMNKTLEFVARHAASAIYENPFKDSAISPYIHLTNGMIHLTKKGQMAEWIERTDNNEDLFRKKYPVHCCKYDFNKKYLKKVDIDQAPVYKFFIDSLIPDSVEKTKSEIQKTRDFFNQIIAYSISPIKPDEFFFGLYGNEKTGKSFFISLLKDIIGDNFFVERPIDEMIKNNRFASSDFWGSKVYVEPDMKTNAVIPEAFVKTFAGQKQITLEKKQKQPEKAVNISIAMFFVSNFDFITKGMEGLARRIIYIPFLNKILKPDTTLRDKIKGDEPKGKESGKYKGKQFDERPVMLGLFIQGWKDFLKNGCIFTMPDWILQAKEAWIQKSDTVKNFITENYLKIGKWIEKHRKDLYEQYEIWCKEERDKKPYGKSRFFEEMDRIADVKLKTVNGYKIYEFFPGRKPADITPDQIDPENPF
jgi:phage/plasmid-associated DNA primase